MATHLTSCAQPCATVHCACGAPVVGKSKLCRGCRDTMTLAKPEPVRPILVGTVGICAHGVGTHCRKCGKPVLLDRM